MTQYARLSPRRRLGTFRLGEQVAHNTPSGFWGLDEDNVGALKAQFEKIRNGEGGTYQASDRLLAQANPDPGFWGHGSDMPPSSWWSAGAQFKREAVWRNANAWVGTEAIAGEPSAVPVVLEQTANPISGLYEAARMNVANVLLDPSGTNAATGSFRIVISRPLYGLIRGRGWDNDMIAAYVDRIRSRLTDDTPLARNMRNACAGWYLEDDTFGAGGAIPGPTVPTSWSTMLTAAQDAQMARSDINPDASEAINLPFFFNWNIDAPANTWVRTAASESNPLPVPRDYYHYDWPAYMLEAMAKECDGGSFPDDAIRAFEPYWYPWQSNKWAEGHDDPVWYRWKKTIEALDDAFGYDEVVNGEYINRDIQFHPIMESGKIQTSGRYMPGHIDMHKQVRVMLDMEPEKRIQSVRCAPWNGPTTEWVEVAEDHWTTAGTERWAEAFQAEIRDDVTQPSTEAIPGANPVTASQPTGLRTEYMDNAPVENSDWWIKYQLVAAGAVKLLIYRVDSGTPILAKTIDEGFTGKSPAGYYIRETEPADVGALDPELLGTAAYWNMHVDDTQKNPPDPAVVGDYEVDMMVDGSLVDNWAFEIVAS